MSHSGGMLLAWEALRLQFNITKVQASLGTPSISVFAIPLCALIVIITSIMCFSFVNCYLPPLDGCTSVSAAVST